MKPVLVGESNPYGSDPEFALYPSPEGSAGHRMCEYILGMYRRDYLESFNRVNLIAGAWDNATALINARQVVGERLVLLGSKVSAAFEQPFRPFTRVVLSYSPARVALILPHPSGLCRIWNDPARIAEARERMREFAPGLSHLIGRV